MTKDEALKLALEALHGFIPYLPLNDETQCRRYDKAITAIKEALAQQEQEPVAWMRTSGTGSPVVTEELLIAKPEYRRDFQTPLYTTPPQRSFDYKEHAEGLQRDYDLLLAEYNLLKQDLITVVDIEKIVKFKERNK